MTVQLYRNLSDSNVVSKTLESVTSIDGTLREPTSLTDPSISLELDAAIASSVNYLYIPTFNRYYYVNGIVSVRNNVWELSCHVDVLMSYANQIRSQTAVIARQENLYNLYLDDDRLLVTSKRQYLTKTFPNKAPSGGCFVLCLAGSPDGV